MNTHLIASRSAPPSCQGGALPRSGDRIAVVHGTLASSSDPEGYARVHRRGPSVVAIGKFDGIHRGHRALLSRVLLEARQHHLQAGVVTFDVHPHEALCGAQHQYLTTAEERRRLFADAGMDFMLLLRATPELFAIEAEDFAIALVQALGCRVIVVGAGFRFGRGAAGDVGILQRMGASMGVQVIAVDLHSKLGGAVSSSRIREELRAGRVERAAELLGRPFALDGVVKLGIGPRWQVEVSSRAALPAPGVYMGRTDLSGAAAMASRAATIVVSACEAGSTQVRHLDVVPLCNAAAFALHGAIVRVVFDGPECEMG